jgi:hypothetical protein
MSQAQGYLRSELKTAPSEELSTAASSQGWEMHSHLGPAYPVSAVLSG